VAAACVALRTCTTFDDLRKDFAGAFDAAKDAVKVRGVVAYTSSRIRVKGSVSTTDVRLAGGVGLKMITHNNSLFCILDTCLPFIYFNSLFDCICTLLYLSPYLAGGHVQGVVASS